MLDFNGSIKIMSTWCYHGSCKLIALKLHNSCSYIVLSKLFKLHMYMVSHIMSYMRCNSCDLSNNIHTHRNRLNYNVSLQLKNLVARLAANHSIFSQCSCFPNICNLIASFKYCPANRRYRDNLLLLKYKSHYDYIQNNSFPKQSLDWKVFLF